ncbi:MAG: hypothetical protein ABSA11_06870 [Candidatus Bathyarchaeia archaeon]
MALLIIEVAGVGLFLLCGQTILSLFGSAIHNGGNLPVTVDEPTQIATITFTFTPHNTGYLSAHMNLGFGLTLTDGSFTVKNTTSVYLPPGAQENIDLSIKVPMKNFQDYTNAKGTLDIYTSIITLNDLVRIDYNSMSEGGG